MAKKIYYSIAWKISKDGQCNITDVINEYETRAELIDVVANVRPDQNAVDVSITFRVVNQTGETTVNILLEKVR